MSDEEPRFYYDLININERERDIILKWATTTQLEKKAGWNPEDEALFERFATWKEQRERDKSEHDA